MPTIADKNTGTFFAWFAIFLVASLGYGYMELMVQQDFVIYTSEETVPTYIVSSSDAE
ncbi:MAG TPA: hypothetical protein VJH91_03715 [Candidatus Paceibacterota bacterium]